MLIVAYLLGHSESRVDVCHHSSGGFVGAEFILNEIWDNRGNGGMSCDVHIGGFSCDRIGSIHKRVVIIVKEGKVHVLQGLHAADYPLIPQQIAVDRGCCRSQQSRSVLNLALDLREAAPAVGLVSVESGIQAVVHAALYHFYVGVEAIEGGEDDDGCH